MNDRTSSGEPGAFPSGPGHDSGQEGRRGGESSPRHGRWPAEADGAHRAPPDPALVGEETYRSLLNATAQGICVVEVLFDDEEEPVDGRFLDVNDAFVELTGLENPVGETMRSLRPEHEDHWFELYGRVARTGEPRRFERKAAALDRWYDVYVFRVGEAEERRVGILFRDVTERRERVQALRQAKVYAESIVETLHEPLLVLTPDLRVKSANPAFYDHFRGDPAETEGRRIYELGNGQWDIPALRTLLEDVLPDDNVFDGFEVEHEFEDLGRRVMLLNARRLDHVQLILLGIRDVTERKRERRELREAKRAAEEANRAKSDFMATISHELRTPLNAILGYTQLLLEGVPERVPAGAREKVDRIAHGARHLQQLIGEVLMFSRVEAGRESAEVKVLSIQELLEEIRAVVDPLTDDAGLRLHLDADDAPDQIRSDPRKLRQILLNLLGNAVKFTEDGSVSLRILERDGQILFRVSDTGPGIEPEQQAKLFEPFWQAEESPSASRGGSGLGLTICQRYAEILDGDLSVDSVPGEGSTFTLRVPA